MKERPILFSGPMVRALLDGSKTQTRRVCKPAQFYSLSAVVEVPDPMERGQVYNGSHFGDEEGEVQFASPYGGRGDRLWVRESWQYADWTDDGYPFIGFHADAARLLRDRIPEEWAMRVEDAWITLSAPANFDIDQRAADRRWRPSIHMPRWASRITLEITSVRAERLRDISESDAKAEGIFPHIRGGWHWLEHDSSNLDDWNQFGYKTPRDAYFALWEAINGPGSVDANPWVWAVEFRKVTP